MSSVQRQPPDAYTGTDRYVEWVRDYLGVRLSEAQQEIIRSIATHDRTLVVGANGFGKSYSVACAALAFLFTNKPSTVLATSGTYGKLRRTLCKPIQELHRKAKDEAYLPGRYKHSPPRIEVDGHPEWYFEAARPRDAGELEGTHNDYLLAIVEEADKDAVGPDVLDSMESLLTDDRDRIVAVANPPHDEANVVYDLMGDPTWNVLQYSSFESHNVAVEQGNAEPPMVDGLTTLDKIRDDWVSWNAEEWPGIEEARTAHQHRDNLDTRWYRRRAGAIPPQGAAAHRPFTVDEVEAAWNRTPARSRQTPTGVGIDVARSGDMTIMAGVHGDDLRIHYEEQGSNHTEQESRLRRVLDGWPDFDGAIDAKGEGSGLADRLCQAYPSMTRFDAGATPSNETEYRDCWTEGLHDLGKWLRNGGAISNRRLREELLVAARVVEFREKHLSSRDDSTVLEATSKSEIKEQLGRSPDCLDAAYMAVTADAGNLASQSRSLTW